MYVRYMVPQAGDGNVPVVMVHGATLTGKSWETTPDGRMGWDEYFVRKGHPVYVPDQVGRGDPASIRRCSTMCARARRRRPTCRAGSDSVTRSSGRTSASGRSRRARTRTVSFRSTAVDELAKQGVPDVSFGGVPNPNPTFKALSDLAGQLNGAVLMGHSQSGAFPLAAALLNPAVGEGARPRRAGWLSGHLHRRADQDAGGDSRPGRLRRSPRHADGIPIRPSWQLSVRELSGAHRSPQGGRRSGADAQPGRDAASVATAT